VGVLALNSRERFIAALELEEPDMVPMFEFEFQYPEKVTGRKYIQGEAAFRLLAKGKRLSLIRHNLENKIAAYRKLGFDAFYLHSPTYPPVDSRVDRNTLSDKHGNKIVRGPHTQEPNRIVVSTILSEDSMHDEAYPEGSLDHIRLAQKLAPEMAIITCFLAPVYSIKASSYVERYRRFYGDVENVKKEIEANVSKAISQVNVLADLGVEIMRGALDDMAGRHGPFMHPRKFDELVFPYVRRIADAIHKRGAFHLVHSDGYLMPIMDGLVDTGIDVLHSIDPSAGMDIGEVKEKYGDKIAICGNVDCAWTLVHLKPEDAVREAKECIMKASPGGGHIFGTSNVIHKGIPFENAMAMIKTGHKYRKYPIKLRE
jgi:uroporphyrinogen decarboxylase